MNSGRPVVRIAHAYGNRRDMLPKALAADVDMIEVDLWYRNGRIEVRHEHRIGWLPVLADRRGPGASQIGPWAMRLPRSYFVRLDLRPLLLAELLQTTKGEKRLLLDLKAADEGPALAFARALVEEIDAADARGWVSVCGQSWPVLDRLREVDPEIEVRYSMQARTQWDEYVRRLERGATTRAVCMHHRMVHGKRAEFLEANGVDTDCWTVDDVEVASAMVEMGVEGVTSNNLGLLEGLRRTSAAAPEPPTVEG